VSETAQVELNCGRVSATATRPSLSLSTALRKSSVFILSPSWNSFITLCSSSTEMYPESSLSKYDDQGQQNNARHVTLRVLGCAWSTWYTPAESAKLAWSQAYAYTT